MSQEKSPEKRFMTKREYAETRGYSVWKIDQYAKLGLPMTRAPGRKRVLVASADAWIANGGPSANIEASAQQAAHEKA